MYLTSICNVVDLQLLGMAELSLWRTVIFFKIEIYIGKRKIKKEEEISPQTSKWVTKRPPNW